MAISRGLARLWDVISGNARRRLRREIHFAWCRVRFNESFIAINVDERPPWRDRVRGDEITAVAVSTSFA